MRGIMLAVVGALVGSTAAQAKEPRATAPSATVPGASDTVASDLAEQLKPALREFEDAWNRHDPKRMAAMFSDDAVLINPYGRIARGRDGIQKMFEDEHVRGPLKTTTYTHRLTNVQQVAPGVLFIDEDVTITGSRDSSGRALPEQHVHGAMLLAKREDRWQVVEGRPYFVASVPRQDLAGARGPSGDTAAAPRQPPESGTGSGASSGASGESTPSR